MTSSTKSSPFRLAVPAPSLSPRVRQVLKDSLLNVTAAIRTRPAPRWQWDDLARPDEGRMRNAFASTSMLRDALREAQDAGPEAFAKTKALVRAYLAVNYEAVFDGFEAPADVCEARVSATLAKEGGEAIAAAALLVAEPSAANRFRASIEVAELEGVTELVRRVLSASAVHDRRMA